MKTMQDDLISNEVKIKNSLYSLDLCFLFRFVAVVVVVFLFVSSCALSPILHVMWCMSISLYHWCVCVCLLCLTLNESKRNSFHHSHGILDILFAGVPSFGFAILKAIIVSKRISLPRNRLPHRFSRAPTTPGILVRWHCR